MTPYKYYCADCDNRWYEHEYHAFKQHEYRNRQKLKAGKQTCKQKKKDQDTNAIVDNLSRSELRTIVTDHSETKNSNDELMSKMDVLISDNKQLNSKIDRQNSKIDRLMGQNEELKEIMLDIQQNPQLLVVCNQLTSLDQLDLKQPQFGPVLEILDKELPEYANLASNPTAQVHAKAIQALNSIQLTAVKDGKEIYFKTESILSKDKDHTTTKSFIDAIGKIGYEYAIKATSDLESTRESDVYFKNQIINNASIDSVPCVEEILTPSKLQ